MKIIIIWQVEVSNTTKPWNKNSPRNLIISYISFRKFLILNGVDFGCKISELDDLFIIFKYLTGIIFIRVDMGR
jgi:hypothetical protein